MSDSLPPVLPPLLPPAATIGRPVYARAVDLARTHPIYLWPLARLRALLWTILTWLILALTFVGLEVLAVGGTALLSGGELDPDKMRNAILPIKIIGAVMTMAFVIVFLRSQRLPLASIGLSTTGLPRQFAAAGLGVFACYGTVILISIPILVYFAMFPAGMDDQLETRKEFVRLLPTNDMSQLVPLLIFVAIHEELVFRGLLIPLLRRATGRWWIAVLISSLIFGSLHISQGLLAILPITGLGVTLSLIFIFSRSLPAVIVTHFFFDFFQILLIRALQDSGYV